MSESVELAAEQAPHRSGLELECERLQRILHDRFMLGPEPQLRIDERGRIVDLNSALSRLTGWRREQVIGSHVWRRVLPNAREAARDAWRRLTAGGFGAAFPVRVRREDHAVLEVSVAATLERDVGGNPCGGWLTFHDNTPLLALQSQLQQADRLAATGRLAASVAHEINNPLQSIMLHLALVDRALPRPFTEQESWQRVAVAVDRIRQIVADLLDLHRGDEQARVAVDVLEVLNEAVGLTENVMKGHSIRRQFDIEPGLPAVHAVGRHIYQVVLNLLLNAIEAMPHGGVLQIRLRAAGDNEIELSVGDTGPGIPESQLPHLFDPFLTSGRRAGTGLGLFVTYGLVRAHGGRIHVDSAPDRGSTFRVFLPMLEPGVEPDAGRRSSP